MTADTVLVLGTNAGQADLIRHMKTRGWWVAACAHRPGGPGDTLADAFYLVDVGDIAAVADLARTIGADLVYSVSSDLAMTSAVAVSARLGLPHFFDEDLIDLLNHKHRLRDHLNRLGLSEVAYRQVGDAAEVADWQDFPCVVKPVNAQGQRGVEKIDRAPDLAVAVDAAVHATAVPGRAIIEQFLAGVEISCNVLVQGGAIIIDEFSERLVHKPPLTGIPKGHLLPCYNIDTVKRAAARTLVHQVVESLGVENGCLYFQLKLTQDGPKIIEIAPRLDGCHIWRLIKAACGIDYLAATMDCLLGEPVRVQRTALPPATTYELQFQQMPPGTAFTPEAFPRPRDALYQEYRYSAGETVQPVNGKMEVVGYYVRKVDAREATKYLDEVAS